MKAEEIYKLVYEVADPILKNYRDDLEKHDKRGIEAFAGIPFIYAVYENATHIEFMMPVEDERWPKHGERVQFYFGNANRWQMLNSMSGCVTGSYCSGMYYLFHFDGRKLRKITPDKCKEIWNAYRRGIEHKWKAEERRIGEVA